MAVWCATQTHSLHFNCDNWRPLWWAPWLWAHLACVEAVECVRCEDYAYTYTRIRIRVYACATGG